MSQRPGIKNWSRPLTFVAVAGDTTSAAGATRTIRLPVTSTVMSGLAIPLITSITVTCSMASDGGSSATALVVATRTRAMNVGRRITY